MTRDDVLLTPKETAALLKRSPRTLADWRVSGSGPRFVKLGEGGGRSGKGVRVAYLRSVVVAWIEAHQRCSTSDLVTPEVRP